jgi:WD40-like Beta Propeller Repeat
MRCVTRTLLISLLFAFAFFPSEAGAAAARGPSRILFSSDWLGPTQIFAVDPSRRAPIGQVTFDRPPPLPPRYSGWDVPWAPGFGHPALSPNGKRLAYTDPWGERVWIANADGTSPRLSARPTWFAPSITARNVRSPNRRMYATADQHGITLVEGPRVRQLTTEPAFALAWSPDSKAIAYITGQRDGNVAETGDLKVVTIGGRSRTVVAADDPYGGQILSLAWVRPAANVRWRPPAPTDGIFAGGPVERLAADGERVAYASCLNVFSWLPRARTSTQVRGDSRCVGRLSRFAVYDLAVAGDRVAWGWKTPGQAPYSWFLFAARVGSTVERATLANGLGYPFVEDSLGGSLVGAGQTLVYGVWKTTGPYPEGTTVETLFRATPVGCPCPAIAYGAAPRAIAPLVPLDTDGERIAVLRYGSLVILDTAGTELLAIPVPAAAAQLIGEEVVVLVPGELRVYSLLNGSLHRSWPLPSATAGHDCTSLSEPHCLYPEAQLRLQDASRGLAAYVLNDEVHLVRLTDGHDAVAAYGGEARFMDDGMVVADWARVRLIPYQSLP